MEFNFNVHLYLQNEITKIESRLIPDGFSGDRREVQECVSRMNLIITTLGENSAQAQGLQRVITSGERLRNSDHTVYVLCEAGAEARNGVVLGMLKVGAKHLYVFDSKGNSHEVTALCILDFYVHESKQRMGLGKKLFEFMLIDKAVLPEHLAIDKPSPKFLSFLKKHYGLETIIPQMNNFVLFEGFFESRPIEHKGAFKDMMAAGISSSVLRSLSGSLGRSHEAPTQSTPTHNVNPPQFGRHSAHRPASTMGMILQEHSPSQTPPQATSRSESVSASIVGTSPQAEVVLESAIEELHLEPEAAVSEEEPPQAVQVHEVTPQQVEEPVVETPTAEPLPCKVQAAHLDLKFYHSSLW